MHVHSLDNDATGKATAQANLIFTLDYEMFGDGSGNATREQCIPTAHLANVLELNSARATLFVEVGQLIYFRKHGIEDGYLPVEAQLRELAARGHDVQLHIHPMWFFAPPPRLGKPLLDIDRFDLSVLPPDDAEAIVVEGCAYLRKIMAPVLPEYRPIAYRAGAWSMRKHVRLFEILARNGILIDSTIAPGAHFRSAYGAYDYRQYQMQPSWHEGPLLEFPILTTRRPLAAIAYINRYGIDARRIIGSLYKAPLANVGRSKVNRAIEIISRTHMMADFNLLAPKVLASMIARHVAKYSSAVNGPIPVVLIGHSKSTYFADQVHLLFHRLKAIGVDARGAVISDYAGPEQARRGCAPLATERGNAP